MIQGVDEFKLKLVGEDSGPTGTFEKIIESVTSFLSDYVTEKIREECKFPVDITIPDTTISTGIASLNASLTDFQGAWGGYLQYIYAKLDVSLDE